MIECNALSMSSCSLNYTCREAPCVEEGNKALDVTSDSILHRVPARATWYSHDEDVEKAIHVHARDTTLLHTKAVRRSMGPPQCECCNSHLALDDMVYSITQNMSCQMRWYVYDCSLTEKGMDARRGGELECWESLAISRKMGVLHRSAQGQSCAVFCCYFNAVKDPQRRINWISSIEPLVALIDSVSKHRGVKLYIFHDCLENPDRYDHVEWVRVDPSTTHSPAVYRWFVYCDYLHNCVSSNLPSHIFMVDSTDVEMLTPFMNSEDYNSTTLFCGDEIGIKKWAWLKIKCNQVPLHIGKFLSGHYEKAQHAQKPFILNAGVVGGCVNIVKEFVGWQVFYHELFSYKYVVKSNDMPIFNYTVMKHFKDRMTHGRPINTPFASQIYDYTCWFKHK